jgi:hypothetical protein
MKTDDPYQEDEPILANGRLELGAPTAGRREPASAYHTCAWVRCEVEVGGARGDGSCCGRLLRWQWGHRDQCAGDRGRAAPYRPGNGGEKRWRVANLDRLGGLSAWTGGRRPGRGFGVAIAASV